MKAKTIDYKEMFNIPRLISAVEKAKKELETSPSLYDGEYILDTIIPASAGIFTHDEFLEMVGLPIPGNFDEKDLLVDSLLVEMSSYLNQQLDNILGQDYTIYLGWIDGEIDLALVKEVFI